MTISDMRLYLIKQYPNSMHWHQKVQEMPTRQVFAIYQKMSKKPPLDDYVQLYSTEPAGYHQIDMFEYMASQTQNHTEVKV